MSDEVKTEQPTQAEGKSLEQNAVQQQPEAQGQQGQQQRVYTEEEFNRHMAGLRKKLEAEMKKAAEEAAARARMDETERLKLEREEALKKAQEAEARALYAERKAALVGHVTNAERVLLLIGNDIEKYWHEEGKPNLEAIYKDFPEYKPAPPATQDASGFRKAQGQPFDGDLEQLARTDPKRFNEVWAQMLKEKRR